jgi:hypothetical protein
MLCLKKGPWKNDNRIRELKTLATVVGGGEKRISIRILRGSKGHPLHL